VVGGEVVRWYLGKTLGRVHSGLGFVVAWLLPLVWLIPLGQYGQLGTPESAIRVGGQTLLPAAAENLLAAFLVLGGGPLASIAYRGVLLGFEWLSPILPDLPWMGAAFVGVLAPVLGLILLQQAEEEPKAETRPEAAPRRGAETASAVGWLLVAALGVGILWLNSGFLGVRPSLISGNSMNPALYPGDVVITRPVSPEAIRVGDVIRFRRDGFDVVHRVVAVEGSGAALVFTTRGDNNNVDDPPVLAEQVQGRVVVTVPKIGWLGIGFRLALAWVGGLL
jgi:signal peptidase